MPAVAPAASAANWRERARVSPWLHQVVGVERLVSSPFLMLADVMGLGKTKQVIDAAQVLREQGEVDHVIVVAPVASRALVWFQSEYGELAKHLWENTPHYVTEFCRNPRFWRSKTMTYAPLRWSLTNYEHLRDHDRIDSLSPNKRTLLVLDESWRVKSWKAQVTLACSTLRLRCGRVWLLNGTPIGHSIGDLYSQFAIMNPHILGYRNWYVFRANHAIMGGYMNKQIVGWRGVDQLQERIAPYILRRTEIPDAPKKRPPVTIPVQLSDSTWALYRQMKREMLAWLSEQDVSAAPSPGARAIRLAQITSGFVGGVSNEEEYYREMTTDHVATREVREFSTEKIDATTEWITNTLPDDPGMKALIWCRFRAEVEMLTREISRKFPTIRIGRIVGGQKAADRDHAQNIMNHEISGDLPAIVIGIGKAGGAGLNLTAADYVLYFSNDTSLLVRQQSEDRARPQRPGRTRQVWYGDLAATGPRGQRTMDAIIAANLQKGRDVASWTTAAWVTALTEEAD